MSIRKEKAKATADLVALGECSLDIVVRGDAPWPVDGKVRLDSLEPMTGGQAATLAVGVARQGWQARCLGVVGDDAWGRRVEADLRASGVETSLVVRANTRTRSAVVLVDRASGRRAVLEHRPEALSLAADEIDPAAVTSARLLAVDATDLVASIHAARIARAAGVPVMVDVDRTGPEVDALLRLVDLLIVPEAFARDVTGSPSPGAAADALARQYSPLITVVTLGPDGAVARCDGHEHRTPAHRVNAVDTTGAGDAFRAGFAAAWLAGGGTGPVDDLLRWAAVTAGLNCLAPGAQAGLPSRAAVEAALGGVTPGPGPGLSDQPPRGR